jgi:hypothetical protein
MVAWVRMDFLASILIIWLWLFVYLPRSLCRVIWPIFLLYLAIMLPLQYMMAIGIPSNWGFGMLFKLNALTRTNQINLVYPWTHWITNWQGSQDYEVLDDNLSYVKFSSFTKNFALLKTFL